MRFIDSRFRPRNINQALGVLLACVMVPLLLGAAALLVAQARQEQELLDNHLSALAQTLVQAVDGELAYGRAQLEVLADSPLMEHIDWPEVYRFASVVTGRRPGSLISVVGSDGQVLLNTGVPLGRPLPNLWKLVEEQHEVMWQGRKLPLSSQRMTREVFERGTVVYSDLYYGVTAQQPVLALSVPVKREGHVLYALTLSFPPTLLEQLLRSSVNRPGLRGAVVDRRGVVVATNAAASVRVGDPALPIPLKAGATAGQYEVTAPDGTALRGAYAVSAANGFSVRVSIPRAAAFSPVRSSSLAWGVLLLALLLTSVGLATLLGRRIAQPLRELTRKSESGHLADPPDTSIAEIDTLADALRAGAEAEQQRGEEYLLRVMAQQQEQLLKESENRLRRVLDQLFVSVAVLDLDGRVIECNLLPLQRAGIERADVVGKLFWECHWWLHDQPQAQRIREAAGGAAGGKTVRFDTCCEFAAGERRTVDIQLAPLRDSGGRVTNLIVSGVDIEARVAAMRGHERSEARAVAAARESDAAHRLLDATLEAAPVGIAVADPQCHVLRVNQVGAELWGIAAEADRTLASQSLRGWRRRPGSQEAVPLPPDQWPLQQAVRERRAITSTIEIAPLHAAGVRRTVLMSAAPVLDAAGQVIAGVVVQVDITDRVQAETALRRADRQKDEFLATLAHELRNPLAPMRTAVELIRLRSPGDEVVQRARDTMERQVVHLSRLVDDLLDVSRITLGTIQLRQETVDLGVLARHAVESLGSAPQAAGLALEQRIADEPIFVRGDSTRLVQCVLNLLTNAVKFTPKGGRITLRVAQEGDTAVVEVSDTGSGISPDNLENIFDLFVQEATSGLHGNTGLGIGLAITRRLVTLHGGTIRATSAGPGQGSTFRMEVPAVSAGADADAAALAAAAAPRHAGGARVLVVDDNRDSAESLGELLSMSGFHCHVAYDGESAVRAVQQEPPDAVLLDIGLPDIDGYEVCHRIRNSPLPRQPVMIALTGWGQDRDRERATGAGFDAHLTKPAEPDRIIELLDRLLDQRA